MPHNHQELRILIKQGENADANWKLQVSNTCRKMVGATSSEVFAAIIISSMRMT